MVMIRIPIQVTKQQKEKLDALRAQGTAASGLIRNLLDQHFNQPQAGRKGR